MADRYVIIIEEQNQIDYVISIGKTLWLKCWQESPTFEYEEIYDVLFNYAGPLPGVDVFDSMTDLHLHNSVVSDTIVDGIQIKAD